MELNFSIHKFYPDELFNDDYDGINQNLFYNDFETVWLVAIVKKKTYRLVNGEETSKHIIAYYIE